MLFRSADGKAHFKAVALPSEAISSSRRRREESLSGSATESQSLLTSSPTKSFVVSTRRGKQFNSLIYAEVDPLNGAPRDAVLMAAEDATELSLAHGDRVTLRNELGTYAASVFLAPIAKGNLQVHWPEANHLIPHGIVDAGGGVPDYNTRVTVEKGR